MSIEERLDIIIVLLGLLVASNVPTLLSTATQIVQLISQIASFVQKFWRWVLKRKHIRDNTWPIEVSVRDTRWKRLETSPTIRIWVQYTLRPKTTPVIVQDVRLIGAAERKDGKTTEECLAEAPPGGIASVVYSGQSPVGRTLDSLVLSEIMVGVFELHEPDGNRVLFFHPMLVIEAEGLPCIADCEQLKIS